MTIETAPPGAATSSGTSPTPTVTGLVCRGCGRPEEAGLHYVCPACFGPLEVAYDLDAVRAAVTPAMLATRPPGMWRYRELLPVDPPNRGLAVGGTPIVPAGRLGDVIALVAPAMLAALVVYETLSAGSHSLRVDARVLGLAAAAASIYLKLPVTVVVIAAAGTTALARALG